MKVSLTRYVLLHVMICCESSIPRELVQYVHLMERERQKASFIVSQFVQMQNMERQIYFHNVESLDDDNRCLFNAFEDDL